MQVYFKSRQSLGSNSQVPRCVQSDDSCFFCKSHPGPVHRLLQVWLLCQAKHRGAAGSLKLILIFPDAQKKKSKKKKQSFLKKVSQLLVLTERSTGQSANGLHKLKRIHTEEDQGTGVEC